MNFKYKLFLIKISVLRILGKTPMFFITLYHGFLNLHNLILYRMIIVHPQTGLPRIWDILYTSRRRM